MVFLVIVIGITIVITCGAYRIGISPVSKDEAPVVVNIEENSTYYSIGSLLKENNLIRSESFYKIYIKIFKPNNLQPGTYTLNQSMGVKGIIDLLENNERTSKSFTVAEGKRIEDAAIEVAKVVNYESKELLNVWNSQDFIDKAISKYWFITEEVKNSKLKYGLEGYFFPDTYHIDDVNMTIENIAYMFLDRMNQVLLKYKDKIESSDYTVHEILTMASIVEHEAVLDEDRPVVAGVFYNRLDIGMMLQSCATLGYAIGEWKLSYSYQDMAVDSPYNTYKYYGLPIGPGGLPSQKSIIAAIEPDNNDYIYFLADVYSSTDYKTYFSKTYLEHQQKCRTYLNKEC